MFKSYLKDNVHFIVPYGLKKTILKQIHESGLLLNISFCSMEDALNKLYFTYDEKALHFISREYELKVENAKMYLDNLFYCSIGDHPSMYLLKEMKTKLDALNYLEYDNNYFKQFENKEVVIAGYYDDNYNIRLIKEKIANCKVLLKDSIDKVINIYEFDKIEEEVDFVAYEIAKLIEKKTDINKIKLINVNNQYISLLKRVFSFYNINIDFNESISMFSLPIVKTFLKLLKEDKLNKAIENLKKIYNFSKTENLQVLNNIIKIINRYNWYQDDLSKIIDLIEYSFKIETIKCKQKKDCVRVSTLETEVNFDNHVFLLGFNQTEFPMIYKNEDYLSDDVKDSLSYDTSVRLNKKEKQKTLDLIKRIENLVISYKLNSVERSFYPSLLIEEINCNLIKNYKIDLSKSFSTKYDEINLASKIDASNKFSNYDKDIDILTFNYPKFIYNSYDNQFKGLPIDAVSHMFNNRMNISFTKLDVFFNGPFKYYLDYILNLDVFEQSFEMKVGNLFHHVLSKIFDANFNFEIVFFEYVNTIDLNEKEKVLLIRLKQELLKNINIILKQYNLGNFRTVSCEKNFSIEMKSKMSFILSGSIDKIMTLIKDDQQYAYLVDYKTGYFDYKTDYLQDGINTQLAVYLYLLSKNKQYADMFIVGYYYQSILNKDTRKSIEDETNLLQYKSSALDGYTLNDASIIEQIDSNYGKVSFLTGIIKTSKGFKKSDRLISEKTIESILEIIEDQINKAIISIENGDFKINPKNIKNKVNSCKYCKYQGICFKKYQDFTFPKKIDLNDKNEEVGDDNE